MKYLLRWATRKENMADMLKHGTRVRGMKIGTSKLKESEVINIRTLYKKGVKQLLLGKMFKIDQAGVSRIVNGKTWHHLMVA